MKKIVLSILSICFCLGMLTGGAIMLSGCNSSSYSENNPLEEKPGGGFDDSQNENDEIIDDDPNDVDSNAFIITISLYFDGNASGVSNVPSTRTGQIRTNSTTSWSGRLTIPSTRPTRSGYTFVEWNTSSSGSGTSYSPGDSVTFSYPNISITLYAQWKKQSSYLAKAVLYYDGNASGVSNVPVSQTVQGQRTGTTWTLSFTISSQVPTRSGYTFEGWNTSSSGNGISYNPGSSISVSGTSTQTTADETLYAQWERDIVYYTVSYSSGSSSATGSVSSQTVESGGSVTVKSNGFSRTGYYFNYWSWNGNIYYPGNTMSNITSNRTLTASWSRRSYTNRYYYRNTNGSQDYDDQTRYYGSTFYMFDTSDISEYVSNGWSLAGWATSSSSTSSSYNPGQSRSSTSTSTLKYYAISRRTVYLSYDSNGGSSVSSTSGTQYWNQWGNYKKNPTLTVTSTIPTRTGYNFLGWSTSSSATSASYHGGNSYTFSKSYNTSSTATLYAVWEAKIIPVSLNWNNGDGGTSMIYLKYDSGWYSNSTATSSITSITAPTRTGFTFNGYNTALNGTGTTLINSSGTITASDTYYSSDGTKTIYAQWKANNPAHYDEEGGYWYIENGYMPQKKVTDNGTISGINSSSTTGTTYYFAGLSLQSKVYNGKEYCQYNNSWYEVMPIKWRLVYASSQTTGYGTETDTLAVMAEIVYADAFSDSFLGANAGYSSESVTELKKNQIDGTCLVTETKSMLTFGFTTINGTPTSVSSNIFIVARDDLSSFTTSANGAEKAGSVKFSDLVKDYLLANGKGTLYYTRDLGTNYNNIFCMNANGDRVQYKANNIFGVQFTIKVTEYACV